MMTLALALSIFATRVHRVMFGTFALLYTFAVYVTICRVNMFDARISLTAVPNRVVYALHQLCIHCIT